MSSRFNDFAIFEDKVYDDVTAVLENSGVTADVYRNVFVEGSGFEFEVGEETRVKRILVHIVPAKQGSHKAGDEIKITKDKFFALTNDDDVRLNDIWVIATKRYIVKEMNTAFEHSVQVKLENV